MSRDKIKYPQIAGYKCHLEDVNKHRWKPILVRQRDIRSLIAKSFGIKIWLEEWIREEP